MRAAAFLPEEVRQLGDPRGVPIFSRRCDLSIRGNPFVPAWSRLTTPADAGPVRRLVFCHWFSLLPGRNLSFAAPAVRPRRTCAAPPPQPHAAIPVVARASRESIPCGSQGRRKVAFPAAVAPARSNAPTRRTRAAPPPGFAKSPGSRSSQRPQAIPRRESVRWRV